MSSVIGNIIFENCGMRWGKILRSSIMRLRVGTSLGEKKRQRKMKNIQKYRNRKGYWGKNRKRGKDRGR